MDCRRFLAIALSTIALTACDLGGGPSGGGPSLPPVCAGATTPHPAQIELGGFWEALPNYAKSLYFYLHLDSGVVGDITGTSGGVWTITYQCGGTCDPIPSTPHTVTGTYEHPDVSVRVVADGGGASPTSIGFSAGGLPRDWEFNGRVVTGAEGANRGAQLIEGVVRAFGDATEICLERAF